MNNVYLSVISIVISIVAVTVSFINYRRSLKLQNENIIYAKRVEAYMEFSTYMWQLAHEMDEISSVMIQTPKTYNVKVEKLLDKFENTEKTFYDTIVKHSLVSDQNITDNLFDLIQNCDFLFDYDLLSSEEIKNKTNNFTDKADVVFEKMKEDLAIENLSKGLASRIKSIPSKKIRKHVV